MNEILQEILRVSRENNSMLKEILAVVQKTQDPKYIMEQDTTDFIMNVAANLLANDIEKNK